MSSPNINKPALHLSKKGLTKPGVVVAQTLLIAIVAFAEVALRHGVGLFTGLSIVIATLGSIRFGRSGTAYVAATTAPLAFAIATAAIFLRQDGVHPSKFGVDFIASLASAAPYLLASAVLGWLNFLRARREGVKEIAPTSRPVAS